MKTRHILLLFFVPFLTAILSSFLTYTPPEAKSEPYSDTTPPAAPADTLSDWQLLEMAIAFTESRYNPDARGKAGDIGVLQITPIYVKELNRLLGDDTFRHEDATDIAQSIRMFETMQGLKNPDRDIELAIHYHNKSTAYKSKVLQNYRLIKRYETMRKTLLETSSN